MQFNNYNEPTLHEKNNIKMKLFTLIFLANGTLFSSFAVAQIPSDLGWRWIGSSVGFRNLTTNFTPYFGAAGVEISGATGLTFFTSPNQTLLPPFTGDVAFEEINVGTLYWNGNATGYNIYNQPCSNAVTGVPTGNCASLDVSYAHIRFNTYFEGPFSDYEMQHLIRHEFGHVLGMGHSQCTIDNEPLGIMAPGLGCWPIFINYTSDEIDLMDAWY